MKLYKVQSENSKYNGRIVVTEHGLEGIPSKVILATPTERTALGGYVSQSDLIETTLEENKWIIPHVLKSLRNQVK